MARPRLISIGDIHGCSVALAALINLIDPQPDDTIITLGAAVAVAEGLRSESALFGEGGRAGTYTPARHPRPGPPDLFGHGLL